MSHKITDENGHIGVPKKPFYKKRWFWILIAVLLILGALNPADKKNDKQVLNPVETTKSQSKPQSKETTSPNKIKLGMSYEEVLKVAGKPDYDGYKEYNKVDYGDYDIWFKNGKVTSGNTKEIMAQAKEIADKEKDKSQDLKYNASFFGRKPVAEIQEKNYVYPSVRVDEGMMYMWANEGDKLIRLDTDDGYTTVYKYDENADEGVGQTLYTGKTIVQKQDKTIVYH